MLRFRCIPARPSGRTNAFDPARGQVLASIGRIDNVYDDKPLACGCLLTEAYSEAADQLHLLALLL